VEVRLGSQTKASAELLRKQQAYLSSLGQERMEYVLMNIHVGTERFPPNIRRAYGLVGIGRTGPGAPVKGQWYALSERARKQHEEARLATKVP
jgi:hypothetical protein